MINFAKMQGVGNDFVVIDARDALGRDLAALALRLCERRFGIGADGLLVVGPGTGEADLLFRMFNPDGSEDMCGNGLRCAILWAYRKGLIHAGRPLVVHGFDRNRACRLVSVEPSGLKAIVTVDMGAADFTPRSVPYNGSTPAAVQIDGRTIDFTPVSTGSAHSVVFLETDIDEDDFRRLSPLFETHPFFPERTSIMWTVPEPDNRYRVRIWERAAGETLGCGTGETAIAAVAWAQGRTPEASQLIVESRGGRLQFERSMAGSISMTGPAEWVFEGSVRK